jgi:ketosteroid isomerase-like protein
MVGNRSPKDVVARYFQMWNTGDPAIALEVLSPDWVDHAHPEVTGPAGVQRAVESIRAGRPDLRFHIDNFLDDGDLIAAVGSVRRADGPETRLVWLVRVKDGRMTEMWTYRENTA